MIIGQRAVVIGAGIAGLAAARALSDSFAQVLILERDENKLRAIVTSTARNALSQSVKMTIPVHDLTSQDVRGYYYFATDRAPKPDEWKYMTQGMVNIDGAPFAFTILTNDGQEAIAKKRP